MHGSFLEGGTAGKFAPFLDAAEGNLISCFAKQLPLAVHAHGLELRLDADARHADYLVCLPDEQRTLRSVREHLAECRSERTLGPQSRRFLAAWAKPDSLIRNQQPVVWLEYDRPEGAFATAPSVFVALESDLRSHESAAALRETLNLLFSAAEASRKHRVVTMVARALPGGALIRHLGAMPARHPAFMRLVIEGLDRGRLLSFLLKLGWPGDLDNLSRLIAKIEQRTGASPKLIDLDFVDEFRSSLGLEFLLIGPGTPKDDGEALLALLLEENWCSHEKYEALRLWLKWTTRESPTMEPLAFWQKLYHIKLTLKEPLATADRDEVQVACKAYWGVWSGPKTGTLAELHAAFQDHLT